jgi:serine/threonine-protein kinase
LRSDHVVKVFDVSEVGASLPFYAMELLDGQDLRRLLAQEGVLGIERAVRIVMGACRGVAAMHDAGLLHRDLKPANLFLTHRDDGQEICKLLDFGVSKRENVLTTASRGAFVGTLRYVPPEQIEDSATVGKRADVYALGAILYEALAGRPAHEADSVERLVYSILNTTPESLCSLNPSVPAELSALVDRAMARDPEARVPRVLDLHDELQALVGQSQPSSNVTVRELDLPAVALSKARRTVATRSVLLGLGAAAVLTALLIQPRRRAELEAPRPNPASPPVVQPAPMLAPTDIEVAVSPAAPPAAPSASARVSTPRPRSVSARPIPSPPASAPQRAGLRLEVDNPYAR